MYQNSVLSRLCLQSFHPLRGTKNQLRSKSLTPFFGFEKVPRQNNRGANPQILLPKRHDQHPLHFDMRVYPPHPPTPNKLWSDLQNVKSSTHSFSSYYYQHSKTLSSVFVLKHSNLSKTTTGAITSIEIFYGSEVTLSL